MRTGALMEQFHSVMEANRMATLRPNRRSVVDHDGAVILDIERDLMLTINSTGSYVWERLRQGQQIDEIIHELASDTGANSVTVDRDEHAFLDELKARHV